MQVGISSGSASWLSMFTISCHGATSLTGDFFRVCELAVNVHNILSWRDKPYVRPLLELIDEHERYGVVLTDREHARLFSIFLGELEEHQEVFARADVTHVKTSGTDHMRSQMNIQRKADLH